MPLMRHFGIVFAFTFASFTFAVSAQTPAPALVRGVVLECDSQTAAGELAIRDADNQVFRYRFDAKTYAERDDQLIQASRLKPGEKVIVDGLMKLGPGAPVKIAEKKPEGEAKPPAKKQ